MNAPVNVSLSAVNPWPNTTERTGQIVGGRYRLEERVARGAMGSIWRGQHVELKSTVAIKFLDVAVGRETEMHGRFLQEARSAAAVRCAHVVQVFDYGSDDGTPFIVMEWLEGETLEQRLARLGVLSPRELDEIFREVACGVSRAHAIGVVHRDLKPSNIFIASEGPEQVTKLIDFGIAKVDEARLGFTPRAGTRAGTVIGTPEYMSPEQLRAGAEIDHSVDLWALGIVAFECLTGKIPFSGNSLTDLVVQICTEKPVAPSSLARVPAGFDRWFAKATSKDIGSRFASAGEMTAALTAVLQSSPEGLSRELEQRRAPGTSTQRMGSVRVDARSGLRQARARWTWVAKSQRGLSAWLSPLRAGLGAGLVAVSLIVALWPAPSAHPPAAPLTAQVAAPPHAPVKAPPTPPEGGASSPSSLSPPPSELSAPTTTAAQVAPPEVAPPQVAPPQVVQVAAPPALPSSRTEPSVTPKPRAPAEQRQARPSPPTRAIASRTGSHERTKSAPEQGLSAPARAAASAGTSSEAATRAGQSRPASSEAKPKGPSADAEALFAERL